MAAVTANNGSQTAQTHLAQEQLSEMSDEQIFQMCRRFGESARYWRQRFLGLLPEANRRRLYLKKGYSSIFEFAYKLAGVREEQVRRVLNLNESFKDKPILKKLLTNGEVSVHKLARIASVATAENQEFLADQVKLLPQSAIETLVRDEKESVRTHTNPQSRLELSTDGNGESAGDLRLEEEIKRKLIELQQKGIDINELLREFLQKRELEIAQEKEQIANEICERDSRANGPAWHNRSSRYIPARVRKLLKKEYGEKCAVPNCRKPKQTTHHTNRFALAGTHNPYYMAPLCKEHHVIAHSIDQKFHVARSRAFESK